MFVITVLMENRRTSTHTVTVMDESGDRHRMTIEIRYNRLEEDDYWEEKSREARLESGETARQVGEDLYITQGGGRLRVVPD